MKFWRFVFPFLFVRNWHTGQKELSQQRLMLLLSLVFMVLLALTLIAYLQIPTQYSSPI